MDDDDNKKQHRKRAAGPKADKKKKKSKPDDSNLTAKQRNPKAFATQSVNKLRRQVARSQDKAENRLHVLDVDRSSIEPPPVLVAVVGPPKVGKTTLIRCLIRNYTKRKINNVQGPITVVTGKKQRVTLVECNNDVNCMIDVAKVCDLALLLIDASFGLEMEVMEFLEMCRTHGMPKIIGVLTHLDMMKNSKQLRKTKKQMKHRLWTELYQGAKLFYLSGMMNGEYQKTEVHNLARFISVQKYRPIDWRATHPYIIADRMEDVTDPDSLRVNPKTDRNVCLYGYVRGTHFRNNSQIHIPGCGDMLIHDMSMLSDPCPLAATVKKRFLNEKDRLIYAPWSGVGGVMWDRDAVYIDLGGSHALKSSNDAEETRPTNEIVGSILSTELTMNEKMADSGLRLFDNTAPLSAAEVQRMSEAEKENGKEGGKQRKRKFSFSKHLNQADSDNSDDNHSENDSDDEEEDNSEFMDVGDDNSDSDADSDNDYVNESASDDDESEQIAGAKWGKKKLTKGSADENGTDEEEEEGDDSSSDDDMEIDAEENDEDVPKWKKELSQRATKAFLERKNQYVNWQKIVYGQGERPVKESKSQAATSSFGDLFKPVHTSIGINEVESTKRSVDTKTLDVDFLLSVIKDCFVTGEWDKDEDAEALLQEDDELYGDFEDLETGAVHKSKEGKSTSDDDDIGDDDDKSDTDDESDEGSTKDEDATMQRETPQEKRARKIKEKRLKQKELTKAMFDNEYDDKGGNKTFHEQLREELTHQAQLNRSEFEGLTDEQRIEYEGFRPGLYVRVQINHVPCEFVTSFDPTYPIIIGGLMSGEQNIGYVNTRLKKHRWHKKILKTSDPLIVSMGWRRFQTVAIYSMRDDNGRYRYIKYTPDHLHCYCTFWGPVTPQGKGLLSIKDVSRADAGFRISSTGTVLEADKVVSVVKKLKCIGTPFKIYSKTAFIKDMFTSALEVTKFEGGKLQTVSGIRGMIKKSVKEGPEGSFRATFEDKILLSDIVFFKTWRSVTIPQLYNLVTTLLLPPGERDKWCGMKTVGQLRRERNIRRTVNPDHLYKPIERKIKTQRPLVIPKDLQRQLPFRDKPKILNKKKDEVQSKRIAIVREPGEQKVARVMKMLTTLYEHKRKQDRVAMRERASEHQKRQSKIDESKAVKQKQRAKHAYYLLGQKEKHKQQNERS